MFHKGQKLTTKGLDMKCRTVKAVVQFDHYLFGDNIKSYTRHNGSKITLDCVIISDGIRVMTSSADLQLTSE